MTTLSTTIFIFCLLYARLHVSNFLIGHHQAFLHYESKMLYKRWYPSMLGYQRFTIFVAHRDVLLQVVNNTLKIRAKIIKCVRKEENER